mmetsp:Transcript_91999/g.265435  ORF Transcript_91999/g.265435 Transcript_91999/m.265435 type:complete len:377 (+) Transcript_91999:601-1731(+)
MRLGARLGAWLGRRIREPQATRRRPSRRCRKPLHRLSSFGVGVDEPCGLPAAYRPRRTYANIPRGCRAKSLHLLRLFCEVDIAGLARLRLFRLVDVGGESRGNALPKRPWWALARCARRLEHIRAAREAEVFGVLLSTFRAGGPWRRLLAVDREGGSDPVATRPRRPHGLRLAGLQLRRGDARKTDGLGGGLPLGGDLGIHIRRRHPPSAAPEPRGRPLICGSRADALRLLGPLHLRGGARRLRHVVLLVAHKRRRHAAPTGSHRRPGRRRHLVDLLRLSRDVHMPLLRSVDLLDLLDLVRRDGEGRCNPAAHWPQGGVCLYTDLADADIVGHGRLPGLAVFGGLLLVRFLTSEGRRHPVTAGAHRCSSRNLVLLD